MFKREIKVYIGNKVFTNDDLDIEFDIFFSTDDKQNVSELVIYNLSDATVEDIRQHPNVLIQAGYRDQKNIATIFTGYAKKISTEIIGVDKETTIILADGGFNWQKATTRKTYSKGMKASYIMRDLINLMGYKPASVQPKNDIVYTKPRAIYRTMREELSILVKETDSKMFMDKGFVYITNGEQWVETGFILNKDTGLVGSPQKVTNDETDEKGKKIKKQDTWEITMLLQPLVAKGTTLFIQSNTLKGKVVVLKGKHDKEFNTVVEVKKVE